MIRKVDLFPGMEEQRFLGDMSVLSDAKADFKKGMVDIFREIAHRTFAGEENVADAVMERALDIQGTYFQTMKGATNVHPDDVREAVTAEADRQQRLRNALVRMGDRFRAEGVAFEVLEPGEWYCEPQWNIGSAVGVAIRVNNRGFLYAFPLGDATTTLYCTLAGEPPAANILSIDEDMVLMFPYGEELGDGFGEAAEQVFGPVRDVKDDFPESQIARIQSGFLLLDMKGELSRDELDALRERYGVKAVVKADSGTFEARIHTGRDDPLQRFFSRV